jgi:hypothetical protein
MLKDKIKKYILIKNWQKNIRVNLLNQQIRSRDRDNSIKNK